MDEPALVRRLHDEGRYGEALAVAKHVLRVQPRHADTLLWVSSCHGALKHPRRALRYARRAVREDPFDVGKRVWLAEVHAWRGERRRAIRAIREALALEPESIFVHRKHAEVLLELRRYRQAVDAAKDALRIDPNDQPSLDLLARAHTHLGQYDAAAAVARTALAEDPEHQPAHARLGWIELTGGAGRDAVAHFREALRLDPRDPAAREGLIEALRARNFAYRWMFRMFFWFTSRSRPVRIVLVVVGFYGFVILANVAEDTPLGTVAAIMALATIFLFGYGHKLFRPFVDLILRFDRRTVRVMKREEILTADLVGTLATFFLVALLPVPDIAKSVLFLTAACAVPIWHAVTWPRSPGRRRLRAVVAIAFLVPLGWLGTALLILPDLAKLSFAFGFLGWLLFFFSAERIARRDGI